MNNFRSLNKDQLQCACSYKGKDGEFYIKPEWLNEYNNGKEYSPSYNIAPTDVTPVLISSSKYKSAQSDWILKPMMWGIIPPWHKVFHVCLDIHSNIKLDIFILLCISSNSIHTSIGILFCILNFRVTIARTLLVQITVV